MKDKYLVGVIGSSGLYAFGVDYILKCKGARGNTYISMTKEDLVEFYVNGYMFKSTSYPSMYWSVTSRFVDEFITIEEMLIFK